MRIAVIYDSCALLRAYHDTDAVQLAVSVKVRHRSIMVSKANGYYMAVLCLKRGILALAVVTFCSNGLSYDTSEKFALIG